jgi:hypothetical protein
LTSFASEGASLKLAGGDSGRFADPTGTFAFEDPAGRPLLGLVPPLLVQAPSTTAAAAVAEPRRKVRLLHSLDLFMVSDRRSLGVCRVR